MKCIYKKYRITAFIMCCLTVISITSCGMDVANKSSDSTMSHQIELDISSDSTKNDIQEHTEKKSIVVSNKKEEKTACTTTSVNIVPDTIESTEQSKLVKQSFDKEDIISENTVTTIQQQGIANGPQNDIPELTKTTKADTETETTNTETIIHSDSAMYDENNNEIPSYTPKTDPVVIAGDGNVLLNGTLEEQMGRKSVRVSKEEAEMLINMLNEIELVPVDYPDPASIPYGGGFIMDIEGNERYILLGGRYLQIGDNYYYDANNRSDALSATIGSILNS